MLVLKNEIIAEVESDDDLPEDLDNLNNLDDLDNLVNR
jgi:hypothetical protein